MDLFIGDVLGNVHVPLVFVPPSITPPWNKKVDNYVQPTFIFANKFLSRRGAIFFFNPNDLKMLKDTRSFLESYVHNQDEVDCCQHTPIF